MMPAPIDRDLPLARRALLVCLLLALAACGGRNKPDDVGEPVKLGDIDRRVKLVQQWSRDIGSGQGKDDDKLTLAVSATSVCAASVDGQLACYDHDGRRQWSQKHGDRLTGGVGSADKLVLAADANGTVYAYQRDGGELAWQRVMGSQILAAPQGDATTVAVQTSDGRIVGLATADGAKRWEYSIDEPRLTQKGTATPVVDRGQLLTGFANGKLVALEMQNGAVAFDSTVAIATGTAEIDRIVDVDAAPVVTQQAVYAVSYNGNLFAFDRRNGRALWRYETSSYREPALGRNKVYLVDEDSHLFALGDGDGDERWSQDDLLYRKLSAPVVFAGYLVVADSKGYLHVLSQVDGSIVGRRRDGSAGVNAPMQVYGQQLYVYTDAGRLTAYTLENIDR